MWSRQTELQRLTRRRMTGGVIVAIVVCSGCSQMPGLRSVGTSMPSLRSMWDRNKESSPQKGTDSYAMAMHANDGKNQDQDPDPSLSAVGEQVADSKPGTADLAYPGPAARKPLESRSSDRGALTSRSTARGDREPRTRGSRSKPDDGIRVTLGQPTNLPSADQALLASSTTGSRSRAWHSDSSRNELARPENPAGSRDRLDMAAFRDLAPELEPTPAARSRSAAGSKTMDLAAGSNERQRHDSTDVKALLDQIQRTVDGLASYQVQMTRSERISGVMQPAENILLSIQQKPRAVRLEWTSGPSQGREVIYSQALDPGSLFVHSASTGLPLPTMKIPVNSPLVRKNSRHSITEAGFDVMLRELLLAGSDPAQKLVYKGLVKDPKTGESAHEFVHTLSANEVWTVLIDPRSYLPTRVEAHDAHGILLERYLYEGLKANPTSLAAADAFDPDRRWGRSGGMLSRLANAALAGPKAETSTTR